jgi:hypothetical protein
MPVAVAAANIGFINFHDAPQLDFRLNESGPDFVAHGMRRAVAAETHDALNLEGADPLLAGQHQMHHAKPLAERLVSVLKDGTSDMREAVGGHRSAFIALPVKLSPDQRERLSPTARAFDAIGPAPRNEIRLTGFLIREGRLELGDCHLMDWLGATAAHGISSDCEKNIPCQIQ